LTTITIEQPSDADLDLIHRGLTDSYWSPGIPRAVVAKAFAHSLCALARDEKGALVGFARVVTDYATFAWLCDVMVLPGRRRAGLGRDLVRTLQAHPELSALRRWMLGTRDAHGVYTALGFGPVAAPERLMEIRRRAPYGAPTT
jgi:GNAT superfamily N-acetyltransferase